jgi:hypothetical protein
MALRAIHIAALAAFVVAMVNVVTAFAAPPGVAAHATVGCDSVAQVIGAVTPDSSNRTVFARIAMPAAFLGQAANENYPLRYWAKAGIFVRPGSRPVDLIVPVAWRNRLAIEWGEGGDSGRCCFDTANHRMQGLRSQMASIRRRLSSLRACLCPVDCAQRRTE